MAHPLTTQPAPAQVPQGWMTSPGSIPGCPPGLEYLTQIDQMLVHQKVELLEAITTWETRNHFIAKNSMGQQIYRIDEESGLCMRLCCGEARGFVLHVVDNMNREVMRITRHFKLCAGCCWCASVDCCAWEVRVEAPPGQIVGYTRQRQSCWRIMLDVMNAERQPIFKIRGPICPCGFSDVNFPYLGKDGQQVGKITKQWTGLVKETFTDIDNFGVTFPIDLDVQMKATLMGTMFLIDFMAFEKGFNE